MLLGDVRPDEPSADPHGANRSARIPHEQVQPLVVGLGDDEVLGSSGVVGFEESEILAETAAVEGRRFDRTATGTSARRLGVVVGIARYPLQFEGAVLQDEGEHLRSAIDVGVDLLGRYAVADDAVEVLPGFFGGVVHPGGLQRLVVGNPHTAARSGARPAVARRLLDQDHVGALAGCGDGGGHSAGTAADDNDVVLLLRHVEHVIEMAVPSPSPNAKSPGREAKTR